MAQKATGDVKLAWLLPANPQPKFFIRSTHVFDYMSLLFTTQEIAGAKK